MEVDSTNLEQDELYLASQYLALGNLKAAHKALDAISKEQQLLPIVILARIDIYEAHGSFLELDAFLKTSLQQVENNPLLKQHLELVQARCNMMIRLDMTGYLSHSRSAWDNYLNNCDLTSCDRTTLALEAEFHRGLHKYVHFVYHSNDPLLRPRESGFDVQSHPFYPLPFSPEDGETRLKTVIDRYLDMAKPEAAYDIFRLLLGVYSSKVGTDTWPIMRKIAEHPVAGPLLHAKMYTQHANALAHYQTFTLASTLLNEARQAFLWLDAINGQNEARMVSAKLGFIALGGLRGLSSTLAAEVLEKEYADMIQSFISVGHYTYASTALSQYMDCVDYLSEPKRVMEILNLTNKIAELSGNSIDHWTCRLIALASSPLKSHIALGVQNIWCQEFCERYVDSGAWEMLRRFAINYALYCHRIGDRTKQLKWTNMSDYYEQQITTDALTLLNCAYHTFCVMLLRLQDLEDQEDPDAIQVFQDTKTYGLARLAMCKENGFSELAEEYVLKLAVLFSGEEKNEFIRNEFDMTGDGLTLKDLSLDEPHDMDETDLLRLYIKYRDMVEVFRQKERVDYLWHLQEELHKYFNELYEVLSLGMQLKLSFADLAQIHSVLELRVTKGLLYMENLTTEDCQKALDLTHVVANRSDKIGDYRSARDALFVAAQWVYRIRKPNWGREVANLLYKAEDCLDITRTKITASSRMDSLDSKQLMVANFSDTHVYTFGYVLLSALYDTKDTEAIISEDDKVDTQEVWEWVQRGKGKSVIDLLFASPAEEAERLDGSSKQVSLAVDLGSRLYLDDVMKMSACYAEQEPGSSLVLVDWYIGDGHIDMIIVKSSGEIHTEILDFTLEHALKSVLGQTTELRSGKHVAAWKEEYLGQSEFQRDILTIEALAELDWLVEPLEKHSKPGDLLVFCPSGVLHGVPLHALSVDGLCLVERNPIVYTGSLSLLSQCYDRALKRPSSKPSAAVFAVYGKSGTEAKSKSKEDIEVESTLGSIASVLETNVSYNITPSDFTAQCQGKSIIHYHGHAILGKERQATFNQSLVLGKAKAPTVVETSKDNLLSWNDSVDDSLLLGDETLAGGSGGGASNNKLTARSMISSLNLSAAHVTLIACNSATQKFSSGDEPQGIIPVLLLCGATSVLGTMWPILSSDGRKASETFYSAFNAVSEGSVVNLAKAVQQSIVAIKNERPEPLHWAGFVLHGAWFHNC